MMQSSNYSVNTEPRRGELYPSGRSLTKQSELMQKDKVSNWGSNPSRKQFITIEDALEIVPGLEKLADILKELGERKYPLAIRRGVIVKMAKAKKSMQIKGSGSTYFLDVEKAKTGSNYLRITQSRKADGDEFERSSVYIFPEDAKEFMKRVAEIIKELN